MDIDTIKLFGEKISVPRNYDIPSSSRRPLRTLLLLPQNPVRDYSPPYISATHDQEDDHDDVDTSLTLSSSSSLINSGNKKPSRSFPVFENSMPPLVQSDDDDDDDVDKSPVMSSPDKSPKKRAFSEIDHPDGTIVYNPTPLRSYYPPSTHQQQPPNAVTIRAPRTKKNNRPTTRVRADNGVNYQNIPPLAENIPGVNPDDGARPQLLYRKSLEQTDVTKSQNRLFINKSADGNVMGFLRDDERVAVAEAKNGLEFWAVDVKGKVYELHLKKWPSLDVLVLNKDWMKMVYANGVKRGDWVELWGYRQNGVFRLVVRFEEQKITDQGNVASCSSSTTNGGSAATMLAN